MKTIIAVILLACVTTGFAVWACAPETVARQSCAVLSTACINAPAEFTHVITDYHGGASDGQPPSEYVSLYRNSDDQEPAVRFEAKIDSLTRAELPTDFTCAPRGKDERLCHRPAPDSAIEETVIMRPQGRLGLQACDPSYDVLYLTPRAGPSGTRLEDYADLRQQPSPPRYTRWQAALDRRKCG
ncbi:hypothetical protein [Asticcacaulis sp.]|uniref:hypothetical protein n=1 Tax=Asticcacaulis sp. TaxID=1872648 RepID=UPI002B5BAEB5|nr:hypothetical protein [Asticcacaulis sp.]HTM82025.1 hypothetical protein [Asticcacaulis sp.]